MKHKYTPKWKTIILALICVIALLTLAGGSYAAYTSQAFQRGVARNRDSETVRFTSNYLQSCVSGTAETLYVGKTKLFSKDQSTATNLTVDIEIYNYANGNTSLVNQKDITYNLEIKLSGGGGTRYSIAPVVTPEIASDNTTYTYKFDNQTLTGRNANSEKYTVTFPGSDLDKLKITATATPTNPSTTNNQILAAVIAPCTSSTTQTFRSEGKYLDESTSTKPAEYAGFNYEISITSGRATATLTWKSDIVEIDKFFLEKIGKKESDIKSYTDENKIAYNTLTFEMDQPNGTGDYLIPFYIKNKTTIAVYKDWDAMKDAKVITFKADPITEQQANS